MSQPASSISTTDDGPFRFVPCLKLRHEILLPSSLEKMRKPDLVAVMDLAFDYQGVLVWTGERPAIERDVAGERHARFLVERLGAVEVDCVDGLAGRLVTDADYVLGADGDAQDVCGFITQALPRLRELGFRVEVAADFPWRIAEPEPPWYAALEPVSGRTQWFDLELGIEVDGRRVNLLPALLDLLGRVSQMARLESLFPTGGRPLCVQVGERDYVMMPTERLRLLASVLRELYGDDDGTRVRFRADQSTALARLDQAFVGKPLSWYGDRRVCERALSLTATPPQAALPPPGLLASLRPYQEQGLAFLQHLLAHEVGGILADDMGLGKTLQTIAHILREKTEGRLSTPVLVVAPTSLLFNWRRELRRFAPALRVLTLAGGDRRQLWKQLSQHDVGLITYATLLRDQDAASRVAFHMVILDEAQAIKNPRSQCRQAAAELTARQRLCLTGTPIENNLAELWSLMDFLNPGILGDEEAFRCRYSIPVEREGNAERLAELRGRIAPYLLRRTKEEVAQNLPPKTELVHPIELEGAQRDLYESLRVSVHAEVRQAIADRGLAASTITILDALMKLRQCCCDPQLLPGDRGQDIPESAKWNYFLALLEENLAAGRRVLVFSQFTRMLARMAHALRERSIAFFELTGATTQRQRPIDAFEGGEASVFLISLKAGGAGINLTSADTVIHYDPWWNPAAQAQATARAHRIGQKKPVFVHKLIVAGSVEEEMMRLQRRKQLLADGLLGARSSGATTLTEENLNRLFAPLKEGD
jgi:superfamily II DNA or RNA helicase